MNQIKPLDQVLSIEADTHNQTTKIVNKFGPQGSILYQLEEFSSSVADFRRSDKGNIRHRIGDIIMLNILARASGCVGRAEIIEFGRYNLDKFRKMGMLRNGVPSEVLLSMLFTFSPGSCHLHLPALLAGCWSGHSFNRLTDALHIALLTVSGAGPLYFYLSLVYLFFNNPPLYPSDIVTEVDAYPIEGSSVGGKGGSVAFLIDLADGFFGSAV